MRAQYVLTDENLQPADQDELERALDERLAQLDDALFPSQEKRCRFLCGQLKRDIGRQVSGRQVAELVHARLRVPLQRSVAGDI